MSGVVVLKAEQKKTAGSGGARALRRVNSIPCIVYGDAKEAVMISVGQKELMSHCLKPGFYNKVFELDVDGKQKLSVLPKSVQYHPVTDLPLHVDFQRVNNNSEIKIHVPIEFINADKSPAIKLGGVLNIVHHSVEISCSPLAIPQRFEVDLSGAQMGKSFTVSVLNIGNNCRLLHSFNNETVIANIVQPQKDVSESDTAAAESAAGTPAST